MPVRFQLPARMGHTDEELAFIREMGIRYLNLNVMPPQANEEDLQREKERLARFDLEISDLACPPLQKNPAIILGRPDREEQLDQFCAFVRLAGRMGVKIVSVAWQPNGIFRTGRACRPVPGAGYLPMRIWPRLRPGPSAMTGNMGKRRSGPTLRTFCAGCFRCARPAECGWRCIPTTRR